MNVRESLHAKPARASAAVAAGARALHFSRQALKRVNELFTWQKVGERMAEYYDQLLEGRTPTLTDTISKPGERMEEAALITQGFETAIETLQRTMDVLPASILGAARLLTDCLA